MSNQTAHEALDRRLKLLDDAHNRGVHTKDEYDQLRAAIIKEEEEVWGRTSYRVSSIKRYCLIEFTRRTPDEVAAYLPSNYSIEGVVDGQILIGGRDDHGWTLHGYVIPRLGSGLIGATEIDLSHPIMKQIDAFPKEVKS